jgi:transaldolase / glucose-6-phosphate isomerase
MNPLKALEHAGQAVWLDYIRRSLITSGELKQLVEQDGLRGVTSNPAILEKSIVGSTDYSAALDALYNEGITNPNTLYERLAIPDIQDAADVLRPVYDRTQRRDGYVSLEVSPFYALETDATLKETRRLWKAVGRENVMIKIPGTPQGIPAIEQAISEGININVTLLFAMEAYEHVAEAFIAGLEKLAATGGDVSRIGSVASFFVSRIDTLVDSLAESKLKSANTPAERALLRSIMGKVAIANAKLTYQRYKEILGADRWRALKAKGAQTQRLLWASTSTKNPKYRDVLYVEELIGPDTVNTIPMPTLEAFRNHGRVRPSLQEELEGAADTMQILPQVGISMQEVTDLLLKDAIRLFAEPFDKLLNSLDRMCKVPSGRQKDRQTYRVPESMTGAVKAAVEECRIKGRVRRLWSHDSSLWTGSDEGNWLGWLGITEDQLAHASHFQSIAEDVRSAGFSHALLLGMGGSSLCPEVMRLTFGKVAGFPALHVLDSTDPAQIKSIEAKLDLSKTVFIVSSKSGSTLEPNIFKQHFFERARQVVGAKEAGNRFLAITDPGSKMQQVAEGDGFRRIFYGVRSIGGRYSALSDFGMVPAAIMGVDVPKFLDNAEVMVYSCSSCVPIEDNPGAVLGCILGELARNGRDKVTIVTSPGIGDLGAWCEQLLAESTGKEGKGLIPVDRERLGPPEVYGSDRVFVYVRLEPAPDAAQEAAVDALERAGQPVVRISVADIDDLGQEFFRWETATAIAGSIIGINPFNQPDVEASKIATRKLTAEYEKTGSLPSETPIFTANGIKLFADAKNAATLASSAASDRSLVGYLRAHLNRLNARDYFAILAYIEMNPSHEAELQVMRHAVRDSRRTATCLGFGPRFLHSTGQAYKGGPNIGVFLQVTCDDATDLPVPGQKYTFGVVKAAQARGDFQVLAGGGRRAMRVHLGADVKAGLATLKAAVAQALR